MMRAKAITGGKLGFTAADARKAERNALRAAAKGAKADFGVTTQTFKSRPEFAIEEISQHETVVGTDDFVYQLLDEGTDPHEIRPKNGKALAFLGGHRAKTKPRVIASAAGGASGPQIIRQKPVHHPGTEAREFSTVIAEKWEARWPELAQRAIDAEVK